MATIAELVIAGRVDGSGVSQGMNDLVTSVTGANAKIGASTKLTAEMTAAAWQRAGGDMDKFAQECAKLTGVETQLGTATDNATRAINTQARGVAGAGATTTQALGGMAASGFRANRAMVSTAFGFEAFVRSAQAGESGITRAGRSISMFALSFGPEGALVAALILGGIAYKDWWAQREKEAEDATKNVQKSLAGMARAFDEAGLRKAQAVLNAGDPFATTEGPQKDESDVMFTARRAGLENFRKSVQQMQVDLVHAQEQLDALGANVGARNAADAGPVAVLQNRITSLQKSLPSLQAELARLDAIDAQFKPLEGASGAAHPVEELTDRVDRLKTAMLQLLERGIRPTQDMIGLLNQAESDASQQLGKQADRYSKDANTLRGLLNELQHITPPAPGSAQDLANIPAPAIARTASHEGTPTEQLQRLQEIVAMTGSWSTQSQNAADQLRTTLNTLNLIIRLEGGELKATTDQLREQVQLTDALAHLRKDTPVGPMRVGAVSPDSINNTNNIVGDVARAKQAMDSAAALHQLGVTDLATQQRANALRDDAVKQLKQMLVDQVQSNDTSAAGIAVQDRILSLLNELGVTTKTVKDNFGDITEGIRGVLDAADGFNGVNASVRQTVHGALDIVAALQKVREAQRAAIAAGKDGSVLASIGGSLGIAGAGIQLISGIAGLFQHQSDAASTAAQQAQTQAMQSNTQKLDEVRSALVGYVGGIDKQTDALKLALKIASGGVVQNKNTFESLAPSFGLTAAQFEQIVKDSGITLFDDHGNLIQGAFMAFISELEGATQAATRLTDSLDDQKAKMDLNARVFGKNSPVNQLQNDLALLATNLGGSAKKLFDGIDASTAAGRAQLETALQGLVTMIDNNTLTSADFGSFANIHDLINTILGVQGALDGMATATNAVTGALTNVPTWYKTNLAAFNAAAAGTASGTVSPFVPSAAIRAMGSSGANTSTGANAGGTDDTYTFGNVYIDARATPAEQLFQAVLKVAKRKAVTKFGDSTRWPEVQG